MFYLNGKQRSRKNSSRVILTWGEKEGYSELEQHQNPPGKGLFILPPGFFMSCVYKMLKDVNYTLVVCCDFKDKREPNAYSLIRERDKRRLRGE